MRFNGTSIKVLGVMFVMTGAPAIAAEPSIVENPIQTLATEINLLDEQLQQLRQAVEEASDTQRQLRQEVERARPGPDREQKVRRVEDVTNRTSMLENERVRVKTLRRERRDALLQLLEDEQQKSASDELESRIQHLGLYARLLAERARDRIEALPEYALQPQSPLTQDERDDLQAYLALQRSKLSRTVNDLEALLRSVEEHRILTQRRQRFARTRRLFEEDLEDRLRVKAPAQATSIREMIEAQVAEARALLGQIDQLATQPNGVETNVEANQ